jgi:hypothetical protein
MFLPALGTAPMTKNARAVRIQYCKGETPMTKNVVVVDEFGVNYGTTYLKRASGLVKHGRARFIDGNRICLTRPPDNPNFLEDITMENTDDIVTTAEIGETALTLREILDRIDKITNDTSHLRDIAESDNISLGEAVCAHEATNQKLIALLERMYSDLVVPREPNREFSYELAQTSYHTFVSGLALLPMEPDTEDLRPHEARMTFEKLFKLERD